MIKSPDYKINLKISDCPITPVSLNFAAILDDHGSIAADLRNVAAGALAIFFDMPHLKVLSGLKPMRRYFFHPLTFVLTLSALAAKPTPSVERLHQDMWNRFVQPNGLLLDYNTPAGDVELPTAEECREGKPNAISWWTPIENGPFFTGLYLDAAVRRWKVTQSTEDLGKARKLAEGLMLSSTVSNVPGFIARGVLPDGKSYYPIGSDDQTAPWFQGLWAYIRSGAPTPKEKQRIEAKMVEVAEVLRGNGWSMPCDASGAFPPGVMRGSFSEPEYRSAARQLFVTRAMFEMTGNAVWNQAYEDALTKPIHKGKTMLQYVEEGIPGWWKDHPNLVSNQIWLCVNPQAMVRELADLEKRPEIREKYLTSLKTNAKAVAHLIIAEPPANLETIPYRTDWRTMNEMWEPQTSTKQTVDLALKQLKAWKNQGRNVEIPGLREPFSAAAILRLSPQSDPDIQAADARFEQFIQGIPWEKLYSSYALFAEYAWYISSK